MADGSTSGHANITASANREYREREAPVDYSRAPAPTQKKPEATTNVLVVGDANADWLAYGLEEAFAEKPEIGIVRKHRTDSGIIRYDPRRDSEWATVAREIVTAEKPKFIVVMIGNHDRRRFASGLRPPPGRVPRSEPAAGAAGGEPGRGAGRSRATGRRPPAGCRAGSHSGARAGSAGILRAVGVPGTEKWEAAYIKRVDATIAALKSAGVPVLWVGLPSQRGPKSSGDSSVSQRDSIAAGPRRRGSPTSTSGTGSSTRVAGSPRRGPTTKDRPGGREPATGCISPSSARKLAHYVERELQRHFTSRGVPVALPVPEETGPGARPGGTSQRPAAGQVVPLTATGKVASEELLGGRTAARAPATDATATRVLTKGEPIAAPSGRADHFSWPRGRAAVPEQAAIQPSTASSAAEAPRIEAGAAAAAAGTAAAATAAAKPATKLKRRARPNYYSAQRAPSFFQGWFR